MPAAQRFAWLVAELHEGALRYRAHSVVDAEGMRKGLISDLLPASRVFNQAATEAEQMANAVIASCVVGLGGPHVRGVNSQGGISLGNRLREITREDVRAAVDRARAPSLCRLTERFCICCRSNSFWMSNPVFTIRWA